MVWLILICCSRRHCTDNRTRRDRTENCQKHFDPQLESMTDAYMAWSHNMSHGIAHDTGFPSGINKYSLTVMDVFGTSALFIYCFYSHEISQHLMLLFLMLLPMTTFYALPLYGKVLYHAHPSSPLLASLSRPLDSSTSLTFAVLSSHNNHISRHSLTSIRHIIKSTSRVNS
jgi:hypothetical protein